ncbi:uncharacterized protein LOC131856825 [Cryptomeria japonica]|uniref:uncharacterized protein LOC131856825 n=1 Tax=Cryptomeria japonica TaxID=3369 RepID=UPI0027DA02DF|nr:uncharacterized protein LOC131856825 [Cryptomeria japonica]
MELIRAWVNNLNANPTTLIDWPKIGASPINEYVTLGLLDMAFIALFPDGRCHWLEPRMRQVHLHEFVKHLLRYRDHRFGKHPRFRYFMMNMIMRHRAQNSSAAFAKRNLQDMPITINELRQHMENIPQSNLADRLIRFGTTLRGTRSYWAKCRAKLTDMLHQIDTPTIFFTLSAADMYWPDLHALMLGTSPNTSREAQNWRKKNVIDYPHIVAHYMHLRHTIFRKEILEKGMNIKDYWCRYEWQHRGSPHVHRFLWINGAPNMDNIDWSNEEEQKSAERYFHSIIHAWNPREDPHQRNIHAFQNYLQHPCLKNTTELADMDIDHDYEDILNYVERHTVCKEGVCLRKKQGRMVCRYNAPWPLNLRGSKLYEDIETGEKKIEPTRNDDRVNSHNRHILQLWRANIDWQLVLSKYVVIKYIAKYAAKAEKSSETYHQMLMHLSEMENPDDLAARAYRRLLTETVIERDMSHAFRASIDGEQ